MEVDNVLTPSQQCYLAEILSLESDQGGVRQSEIAARLGVNKPSVTAALRGLAKRNLISYRPYGAAILTPEGRARAETILVRRRIIREYLVTILDIAEEAADDAARHMQCALPDIVVDRFSVRLKKTR